MSTDTLTDMACICTGVKCNMDVLTDKQREMMQTASDMGYFEVPREVGLAAVADEIGISSQAASERLRRGQHKLFGELEDANV